MERAFKALLIIICLTTAVLLLLPFISLLLKIRPIPFVDALKSKEVLSPLSLSIFTSLISTLIALILGTGVSYVLYFKRVPISTALSTIVTLPMVLPPSVAGYLMLITFGRYGLLGRFLNYLGFNLMFTKYAIIIAQVFVILPFIVNSTRASFEDIDPHYQKAAKVLGASEWYTFKKVILPLSKNGIYTGMVLAFARAMGEFGATMLVSGLNETMTIAIYNNAMSGKRLEADVLSVILIVVSFGVLLTTKFAIRPINHKFSLQYKDTK
jgi:molybdate transport system permease protein